MLLPAVSPTWHPTRLFASGADQGFLCPSISQAVRSSRIWQDSARTTLATTAGHPVGALDDWSGKGNNATQGTSTRRPALQQDSNGNWYIDLDGTDDYLATPTITPTSGEHASIAVVYLDATGGNMLSMDNSTTGDRYSQFINPGATSNSVAFDTGGGADTDLGSALSTATKYMLREQTNSSTVEIFVNGASGGGTAITGTLATDATPLLIGARNSSVPTGYVNGRFYGGLMICRALTASEIAKAEAYFNRV